MFEIRKSNFELAVIQKVKEIRENRKLGQRDIAALLGVTEGFIGQIESPNNASKYNLNHLNILAKELECSPKDFLPDEPVL
ncbi:helix-turn-helix domain-containing protein [Algoriphagus sp. A40]|uniref:helix-turn-helix domain-containing protein n=1 Tax=Algoriphagus sp. A40 TaxID=1945863 RepID=UPI00098431C1|nr:helix-turn-helix transcriptional regulator [Algoriphagus sp. A40]OOG76450.1 transcriptional regulator [Algoriphagus sp. A40]